MKQKGNILILILILVALAIVGYFAYKNYIGPKGTILGPFIPPPTATADPTANWETYTNAKYGFSFKHPENFGNQGVVAGPFTGTSVAIQSFSDPSTIREGTDAPFDGFSLYVVTNTKTTTFQKYLEAEKNAMDTSPSAFMADATVKSFANGAAIVTPTRGYYYLLSTDQKTVVVFAYIQQNETFRTAFDQILSTFKFTKATSSASPNSSQTGCTLEAKMCPDGSAVGRTGPNCEFAPCPTPH